MFAHRKKSLTKWLHELAFECILLRFAYVWKQIPRLSQNHLSIWVVVIWIHHPLCTKRQNVNYYNSRRVPVLRPAVKCWDPLNSTDARFFFECVYILDLKPICRVFDCQFSIHIDHHIVAHSFEAWSVYTTYICLCIV